MDVFNIIQELMEDLKHLILMEIQFNTCEIRITEYVYDRRKVYLQIGNITLSTFQFSYSEFCFKDTAVLSTCSAVQPALELTQVIQVDQQLGQHQILDQIVAKITLA